MSGHDQREKIRELERRAEVAETRADDERKAKQLAERRASDEHTLRLGAEGKAEDEQIRRERVEGGLQEIREVIGSATEDETQEEIVGIIDRLIGGLGVPGGDDRCLTCGWAGGHSGSCPLAQKPIRMENPGLFRGAPTEDGFRFERIDLEAFGRRLQAALEEALQRSIRERS